MVRKNEHNLIKNLAQHFHDNRNVKPLMSPKKLIDTSKALQKQIDFMLEPEKQNESPEKHRRMTSEGTLENLESSRVYEDEG